MIKALILISLIFFSFELDHCDYVVKTCKKALMDINSIILSMVHIVKRKKILAIVVILNIVYSPMIMNVIIVKKDMQKLKKENVERILYIAIYLMV